MTDHRDEHEPYGITPQVEHAEIVPWLRMNAEHASRASHSAWQMFGAAANAIERLTTERDEARRYVCECRASGGFDSHDGRWFADDGRHILAREYAAERGWDCFRDTIAEGDKGGIAP
jgi:hypothetical protein